MTDPKNIFISHATKDDVITDSVAKQFQDASHITWVDHHGKIPPGTPDWDEAIRKAIVACDIGVLVMTENALTSRICRAECLLVQQLGKPLYIIHAEKCKPENVWLYIKMIQYADITAPNFDRGMTDLIRAINGETDPELPTAFYPQLTGRETLSQYLPYLDTPLRGRSDDVDKLRDMLKQAGVTQLIGVGGLGKSRISAEIALAYPNGAIWHRCMNTSSQADVLSLMRTHFRLADDAPLPVILDKMQDKKPLVILDNAEDVVNADQRTGYIQLCNQLAHYGVPVLLNARVQWDDQQPHRLYEPKPLTDLASATQIVLDFSDQFKKSLTHDQAEGLAKSARLHPKLIEISVGFIGAKGLAYTDVIRRLNELKHKDIQKALYEMITKTLDQMKAVADDGENAYALIHNLTWLQATFTEAIMDALKPATITTRDEFIDAVATLRQYQFIRHNADTDRYSIPDLVRDTIGTPKDPALFGIYADFYTKRAKEIFDNTPIQHWGDKEGGANFDDVVNIKALGADIMRKTQKGTTGDLARAIAFAYATTRYVNYRMEEKAWAWTEMGISAVRQSPKDTTNEVFLKKRLVLFLNNMGGVYSALGDKQKALVYYEQALPIRREVGDRGGEATTLNNMGGVYDDLGDKQKALVYYEQALPIRREVGDRGGEATTLNNMGLVYDALGDKQKALVYYEQALTIMREVGDRSGEAVTCFNIGMIYHELGDLDKAIEYVEHCVMLDEQVQHPDLESDRRALMALKRKRGDTGIPPEQPPQSEFDTLIAKLADIYRQAGEDGLRDVLKQNNISDAQIDEIITVVIAQVAGGGGDDTADESADMLPFETIQQWVSNTYAVMKHVPDQLADWRDQLDGAKSRMAGMGDDWQNEVQFVDALLAVLRGEKPSLPESHPYHEPVRQLLEALG
ncbi:MAG: tetratricopeptide repeat protein [Anaerolineae bacterium]|nr:tetratricopeptide repeat protein [Anaerolineae bacterium]